MRGAWQNWRLIDLLSGPARTGFVKYRSNPENMCYVEDRAHSTVPTEQHELDHTDRTYQVSICPAWQIIQIMNCSGNRSYTSYRSSVPGLKLSKAPPVTSTDSPCPQVAKRHLVHVRRKAAANLSAQYNTQKQTNQQTNKQTNEQTSKQANKKKN